MKLIDCFMYFDEDLMLDLRLNILNKNVDKFIIAEATRDHGGNEKKLNFDIKNFTKFKDKIEYLIIDDVPINVTSKKKNWSPNHWRDQHQRNSIARGFKNYSDDDLIMISDIDEIPDLRNIDIEKVNDNIIAFSQFHSMYKLNLLIKEKWIGSKLCKFKKLKTVR